MFFTRQLALPAHSASGFFSSRAFFRPFTGFIQAIVGNVTDGIESRSAASQVCNGVARTTRRVQVSSTARGLTPEPTTWPAIKSAVVFSFRARLPPRQWSSCRDARAVVKRDEKENRPKNHNKYFFYRWNSSRARINTSSERKAREKICFHPLRPRLSLSRRVCVVVVEQVCERVTAIALSVKRIGEGKSPARSANESIIIPQRYFLSRARSFSPRLVLGAYKNTHGIVLRAPRI